MAISHDHLILLLLLLSFFWLLTLLAIPFGNCGDGSSPVEVTSVDIREDKAMASFQISGSTSKSISKGFMSVKARVGVVLVLWKTYDLCEYITCPVAPGPFVLPFENMFPSHSPVSVNIFEDIDDSEEEIICLTFNVQTKRSGLVSA